MEIKNWLLLEFCRTGGDDKSGVELEEELEEEEEDLTFELRRCAREEVGF